MKTLLYFLLFISSLTLFSQEKAFEITNLKNGKSQIYTENTRLKIRTLDRKKHVGKIHFSDNQTIIIDKKSIKIDSILSIKKQPFVLGTIKTTLLLAGLTTVGASLVKASSGKDEAIILFLAGSGTAIGSGILGSFNPNHTNKKWSFKIIEK
ncbi:MAG: hypothetical protein K9I26_08885 [Flavobacterium sp.]|nr:hypothetical protein [Flavobacterium sp.]